MHKTTKIATCCYCGTRSTLVLDRERHELTCSACGAPLHNLKQLPREKVGKGHHDLVGHKGHGVPRRKPRKRRKSLKRRIFEELIDVVEDIFD